MEKDIAHIKNLNFLQFYLLNVNIFTPINLKHL